MRNTARLMTAMAVALLIGGLTYIPYANAAGNIPSAKTCKAKPKDTVTQGGCITVNRKKGNCMACHMLAGGDEAGLQQGNIAPPLIAMKQRMDKSKLRAMIWDATQFNPQVLMPPFGKHKVLTEEEIDKVVEFIWTL